MRQYQLTKTGDHYTPTLTEVSTPTPGPNDVLVRVRATSLNYRDHLIAGGGTMGDKTAGVVPLSDGAGEVAEVGTGVTKWRVGDRVAANFFPQWLDGRFDLKYHEAALGGTAPGMLTKFAVLPEHALVRVPDYLSFEEAAALPCAGVTAYQALFPRGDLQAGETVLVLGTGGVSILGLQMAHAHGARVIVTSSSDEKLARAKTLGAWETINYKTTPDWEKEVWRLTEKHGADHVLEVGGSGTLGKSLSAVAAGGQIALIGVLTGFGPPPSLFPLTVRNATINGIYVGSVAHFEAMNAFLTRHQVHPVIDKTFAFEDAPAAYEHLASGSHFGKIVITV